MTWGVNGIWGFRRMDVLGEDLVEDFDRFGEGFAVVAVGVEEVSDFRNGG